MKTTRSIFKLLSLALIISMITISCDENPEIVTQQDILPESFGVDIPSSISNPNLVSGGRTSGRAEEDFSGDDIYEHLGFFIAVGEGASELVEAIIIGIGQFNIQSIQTLTYTSDDDGRDKNMVVLQDVTFEGTIWEYQLTITDADSEGNQDGGNAMQVFWNNSPVKGIAILKPFNIDRLHDADAGEAIYRVDYSEVSDLLEYDSHMEVSISDLPLAHPDEDQFSLRTMRMFAGKKGDVVDVYGNSSHPNAKFFTDNTGFNWAFVASGSDSQDIGVAEVGLPPSDLNSDDRDVLLGDYAIRDVFTDEITDAFPLITDAQLDALLVNTNPPGYFDKDGFLNGGTSPGDAWNPLADRLNDLTPYNPLETSNLEVMFK